MRRGTKSKKSVLAKLEEINPFKIQTYLAGMDYPATKEDILDHADHRDASQAVMDVLHEIPDREYATPADLMKEIGKII